MLNQYEKAKVFGITSVRDMIKEDINLLNNAKTNVSKSMFRTKNTIIKKVLNKVIHNISLEVEEKTKILASLKKDTNAVTDEHVAKAKTYPIKNLISFKGKLAKCIFHNERTASMFYYERTNTVYCHACQKYSDSIGVYMQINNVDFLTAIRALTYAN